MRKISFVILSFFVFSTVHAKGNFLMNKEPKLTVNNRILANVNGNPISVMDVMKKMDVVFYRQYPEYRDSVAARTQFYQMSWKDVLQQLIDKELITADAAEGKLEVSNGDIRQELENMFGPNIIENLDRIGMSFDEAWNIVKDEIIIGRMLYFRVNMKAMKQITPQTLHQAYEEYTAENIKPAMWHYSFVSIQDKDEANSAKIAEYIHHMLVEEALSIDMVKNRLEEEMLTAETTKVTFSKPYDVSEFEISDAHKNIIASLETGSFSAPVAQKNRLSNEPVYRIFHLEQMTPGGIIPFHEVQDKLTENMRNKAVAEESEKYLTRLRHHFHADENDIAIPTDFQPFVLS